MFKKEVITFAFIIQLIGDDKPSSKPESYGDSSSGEKKFTQDEVDLMIKERLKCEGKSETKTSPAELRLQNYN